MTATAWRRAMLACGMLIAFALGGWSGLAIGAIGALMVERVVSARARRNGSDDRRAAADLPFALDLCAAALRAGSPTSVAVRAAADALDGPIAAALGGVARALGAGEAPREAWSLLATIPGGRRAAAAATRSADSGAALASALVRLADELRASRAVDMETAARRAGVLIVLPLGLCFLPAFLLAGVVPVVFAVLGEVLHR